jgi:chromosome partitioning protein
MIRQKYKEEQNTCKVIAIANQKVGVCNTTTAVNLGISLADEGNKVLLIDVDPQGSMTISLGYKEPDNLEYTLSTLLSEVMEEQKLSLYETIIRHGEGVDLIPANIELSVLEINLVNAMSREIMLRSVVEHLKSEYDYNYIIIDCMPSLGMLTINALACADSVLIPVQAAYLPVKGLEQLIKTIGRVQRRLNKNLYIEGILLTMVDARTNFAKDISQLVVDTYSDQIGVFETLIPLSVMIAGLSIVLILFILVGIQEWCDSMSDKIRSL